MASFPDVSSPGTAQRTEDFSCYYFLRTKERAITPQCARKITRIGPVCSGALHIVCGREKNTKETLNVNDACLLAVDSAASFHDKDVALPRARSFLYRMEHEQTGTRNRNG